VALIWFCHPLNGVEEIKKYYRATWLWRATKVVDVPLVTRVEVWDVALEPSHPSVPIFKDLALKDMNDSISFLRKFGEYVRGINR
jgi:hypothetical protein